MNKAEKNNNKTRPPVVVILGHVDHGKTSILDYIRKTSVVEGEAGGITQHIGAYQIIYQQKAITFVDTPGHEAFSAMRSRGAKVADIAILVVAADEGPKPQTIEAINIIKKSGLPFIVAINKIDKREANPEKVKGQLAEKDVLVESMGGKIPAVYVSAKTGVGIDELFEMILLISEMENFTGNSNNPAEGVIIESHMDAMRGPVATLLVRDGTLHLRDTIVTQSVYGPARSIVDWQGKRLNEAGPSLPVEVIGFAEIPGLGEKFSAITDMKEAKTKIEEYILSKNRKQRQDAEVVDISADKKVLNIIIKADVRGSLEAIRETLHALPQEEVALRILKAEAGDVTENDVKLAMSGHAAIFVFHAKAQGSTMDLAQREKVRIYIFDIIYELFQKVRELMEKQLGDEIIEEVFGKVKLIAIFKSGKGRQIVGGKVIEGKVEKPAKVIVMRAEEEVGRGRLIQLQNNKKDMDVVEKGREAGIMFEGNVALEDGDILSFYRERREHKTL